MNKLPPRPWETLPAVATKHGAMASIIAPPPPGYDDDVCPVKVLGRTIEHADAMASDLVRCINAHDDLLEACKLAWNMIANFMQGNHPEVPPLPVRGDFMQAAEAAIAKAEKAKKGPGFPGPVNPTAESSPGSDPL